MIDKATLQENFAAVEARIVTACTRAGRRREDVTLIAVSKLHPAPLIRLAWELGQRHFGENYAQELRDKHQELAVCEGLQWHAIGAVQRKNAKYVASAASVFHALDRLEVAQALSTKRIGAPLACLVEINVAGEASKAGLNPAELPAFLAEARSLPQLDLIGLTAMPPPDEDPERSRSHFSALRQLAQRHHLSQLSMGTTFDFEVAIEEGATFIRVGTALFGPRV